MRHQSAKQVENRDNYYKDTITPRHERTFIDVGFYLLPIGSSSIQSSAFQIKNEVSFNKVIVRVPLALRTVTRISFQSFIFLNHFINDFRYFSY